MAELCDDGEYRLIEPFSAFPIRIHGITSQQEWQETAQTVKSYAAAHHIPPYGSEVTDGEGVAFFGELETGLYMVKGTTAHTGNGEVVFHDFMIYLPTPVEGGYDYDCSAKPKSTAYTRPGDRYSVVKLWKDSEGTNTRPVSVVVDILKDGAVQETVTLNSANNWSYSWEVSDTQGVWTVMERDVPEGYVVSITGTETAFVITNTLSPENPDDPGDPGDPDDPDDPDAPGDPEDPTPPNPDVPKTGDTAPLLLYAILLCVSGLGLMILGALSLKGRRNEKKR